MLTAAAARTMVPLAPIEQDLHRFWARLMVVVTVEIKVRTKEGELNYHSSEQSDAPRKNDGEFYVRDG